ncbi:MAG: hypothetical protein U5K79_03490 [Cyclobacteriaceae bacterium]|nr:hypothetical protein [Cyclobacteriaceae bacterium]
MTKVVLVGAGGKMGCRITDNLEKSDYSMAYLEVSDAGKERLAQRGSQCHRKRKCCRMVIL